MPVDPAHIHSGSTYALTFENSAEGALEFAGCPLTATATCEDSRPDYLTFEEQLRGGAEGFEFFRRPDGEWWDENGWTRLVSAEYQFKIPISEWGGAARRGFASSERFAQPGEQVIKRTNRNASRKWYRSGKQEDKSK